jgi:hypothetical protein
MVACWFYRRKAVRESSSLRDEKAFVEYVEFEPPYSSLSQSTVIQRGGDRTPASGRLVDGAYVVVLSATEKVPAINRSLNADVDTER